MVHTNTDSIRLWFCPADDTIAFLKDGLYQSRVMAGFYAQILGCHARCVVGKPGIAVFCLGNYFLGQDQDVMILQNDMVLVQAYQNYGAKVLSRNHGGGSLLMR